MDLNKQLSELKGQIKTNAGKQLGILEEEYWQKYGMYPGKNLKLFSNAKHKGGEWDWWESLSSKEKNRLRRNWMSKDAPFGPDQIFDLHGADEWLEQTRRIDVLRTFASTGRLPKTSITDAYGNIDIDDVLRSSVDDISSDYRVNISPSELFLADEKDQLEYFKTIQEESKIAYGEVAEELEQTGAKITSSIEPEMNEVRRRQKIIQRAKETKLKDIERRKSRGLSIGKVVETSKSKPSLAEQRKAAAIKRGAKSTSKPSLAEQRKAAAIKRGAKSTAEIADETFDPSVLASFDDFTDTAAPLDDFAEEMFDGFIDHGPPLSDEPLAGIVTSTLDSSGPTAEAVSAAVPSAARASSARASRKGGAALAQAVADGNFKNIKMIGLASAIGFGAGYASSRNRRRG